MLKTAELKIAAAVAAFLILGAAYGIGRWDGARINELKWQKRETQINAQVADKIKEATKRVLAEERGKAFLDAEASTIYQEELRNEIDKKDRVISGLHDGTMRLYDKYAKCPSSGNATGSTTSSSAGRDGGEKLEFSRETSEFLVNLAGEADQVVNQLQACQKILKIDRGDTK